MSSGPTGAVRRAPAAYAKTVTITMAVQMAIDQRATWSKRRGRIEKCAGRRRSTRMSTTVIIVSTKSWVAATSGAPYIMNKSATPKPVPEIRRAALSRRRARAAPSAASAAKPTTANSAGCANRTTVSGSLPVKPSAPPSITTNTRKIAPRCTGSEPRWKKAVVRTASESTWRMEARNRRSASHHRPSAVR